MESVTVKKRKQIRFTTKIAFLNCIGVTEYKCISKLIISLTASFTSILLGTKVRKTYKDSL